MVVALEQRLASFAELRDVDRGFEVFRLQPPQPREHGVSQTQATIAAEHRDTFRQVVDGRALHRDQRVVGPFQRQTVGDVFIDVQQTPKRVRGDNRTQRPPVRAVEHFFFRAEQGGVMFTPLAFERGEIGNFRQPPLGVQMLQDLVFGRVGVEPTFIELPHAGKGAVVEGQAGIGREDGDAAGQIFEDFRIGGNVALKVVLGFL